MNTGKRENIMKVLMLNGSSKPKGNTYQALEEAARILNEQGIETEIFNIGGGPVRDCIACGQCSEQGCVFTDDKVNDFVAKAKTADGFVFGTPVYYAHPSGRILSFLDRVFYCGAVDFTGKPGFSIAVARRAGTTASFDVLNKYFAISGMIQVGSTYWEIAHGLKPGDIQQDEEGLQTMRNAARYLAWIMKCIEQSGIEKPEAEHEYHTNFIR